MISIENPMFK